MTLTSGPRGVRQGNGCQVLAHLTAPCPGCRRATQMENSRGHHLGMKTWSMRETCDCVILCGLVGSGNDVSKTHER